MQSYAAYRSECTPSVHNRTYSHLSDNPNFRQLGKRSRYPIAFSISHSGGSAGSAPVAVFTAAAIERAAAPGTGHERVAVSGNAPVRAPAPPARRFAAWLGHAIPTALIRSLAEGARGHKPHRTGAESFCACWRGAPPCASRYESIAARSAPPMFWLGMRTVLYVSNRAVAIGSPSASILSGSAR
jgi:hypothetical protein